MATRTPKPKRRRERGDDGISWDRANKCYVGTVSLGYESSGKRLRRTVRAKTKQEVKDKLESLHDEIKAGVHTPATYTLMNAPHSPPGATQRSARSSATLLRIVAELAGPQHVLLAARTIVAWANGFITMELAGAFRLGGDVEQAWTFGLDQILAAIRER